MPCRPFLCIANGYWLAGNRSGSTRKKKERSEPAKGLLQHISAATAPLYPQRVCHLPAPVKEEEEKKKNRAKAGSAEKGMKNKEANGRNAIRHDGRVCLIFPFKCLRAAASIRTPHPLPQCNSTIPSRMRIRGEKKKSEGPNQLIDSHAYNMGALLI